MTSLKTIRQCKRLRYKSSLKAINIKSSMKQTPEAEYGSGKWVTRNIPKSEQGRKAFLDT